jgi:hypothetical protein
MVDPFGIITGIGNGRSLRDHHVLKSYPYDLINTGTHQLKIRTGQVNLTISGTFFSIVVSLGDTDFNGCSGLFAGPYRGSEGEHHTSRSDQSQKYNVIKFAMHVFISYF